MSDTKDIEDTDMKVAESNNAETETAETETAEVDTAEADKTNLDNETNLTDGGDSVEGGLVEGDSLEGDSLEIVEPTQNSDLSENIPAIIGSSDHRFLGRLWMGSAALIGLSALSAGVVLAFAQRNETLISPSSHTAFLSTYKVGMLFLFLVPLIIGLATYIVPRQIGATSLVFPRAGLLSFWAWLAGATLFIVAFGIDGGLAPGAEKAVELSVLAFMLIIIAILTATLNLVSTIIASRVPNMSLWQVPFFSWSIFTAGSVWLLSLPVLFANLMTMWVDLRGTTAISYGEADNLYNQVEWVFDQPQIFIFALPILGIFADITIATHKKRLTQAKLFANKKRINRYELFQLLIATIAILSFGAYAQEFFAPNVSETPVYVLGMIILFLMCLGFFGLLVQHGTKSAGGIQNLNAPLVLATFSMLAFILALGVGVIRVLGNLFHFLTNFATDRENYQTNIRDIIDPLIDLKGTVISNAVFHLVIVAGIVGVLAGIYYWAPKILGKQIKALKGLSLIGVALLALGGATLWALGDVISGFLGFPENPLELNNINVTTGMQHAATLNIIGAFMVGAATLIAVLEIARVAKKKQEAVIENPWNAPTLEWAEDDIPTPVTNAYPLWEQDK